MNRIKQLRQSKNMTLKEVGKRLGVSEGTVQRYESGAISNIKYDTIVKLADLFDCSPCYVMGWESDPVIEDKPHIEWSANSQVLISLFDELNGEGQEKVIEYARLLNISPEYKKMSSGSLGRKAE